MLVPIFISNRHVHLSKNDAEILFKKDYKFNILKELGQPGQFAYKETISIIGEKGVIENIRILGPFRDKTQIEISKTDGFKLGITPPIRESGDLKNSSEIILQGPQGKVKLKEGLIISKRHIHMPQKYSTDFGFLNGDIVKVKVAGDRGLIFDQVILRVSENFEFEMHIDQDEANAGNIKNGDFGEIIDI